MDFLDKKESYESPSLQVLKVELETGIAATSAPPSGMNESWNNSSSSQDVEW